MKYLTLTFSALTLSLSALAYESYIIRTPDEVNSSMIMLELSEDMQDEFDEVKRQIKENGYYSTYSQNAQSLIAFKDKKGIRISKESDPYFNNLRLDTSDFLLTFPFTPLTSVDAEHLLGFAPGGTFQDNEWTGVVEYFMEDNFGVCRFNVDDFPSSNSQSIYDSSYTTYEINGKPTIYSAKGSEESGFIYDISWTGKKYEKELECANNKPFDKQMLHDLVAYAKKIDLDLPDKP